jgi:hypothetical protein
MANNDNYGVPSIRTAKSLVFLSNLAAMELRRGGSSSGY